MAARPGVHLLLAAAPTAPGARELLARAAAEARGGTAVRVLLSGPGLAWAAEADLAAAAGESGLEVAVCSRSARDHAPDRPPASWPPWIRWSSLVTWLLPIAPEEALWTATA